MLWKCDLDITQIAEQMLNTFEREILRRIYGPTQDGGGGDAGVPDGTANCTVDTMSQTSRRTLKSEDQDGQVTK